MSSGKLSFESPPFLRVTWNIPDFFHLATESGYTLQSPDFTFADNRYCLQMYPTPFLGSFHIRIKLSNLTDTASGRYVSYEVGLQSTSGENIDTVRSSISPNQKFYVSRDELYCKKSQCCSDGHLIVFCSMHSREPSSAECSKSGGVQTPNEEENLEKLPAINKVLKDFQSLLDSRENSDVTLVVGGKEFPSHRIILCARSPVFKAMLCHDTSERDSGTVNIDDCDPDGFQDFLTYVYTGSTRHISTGNMISLYATSDKYLMSELKEACVSFMKANMSVEDFCSIVTLALRHEENELIELATKFFCEKCKEITQTENWVTFLDENPKEANEHFIKPSINRL